MRKIIRLRPHTAIFAFLCSAALLFFPISSVQAQIPFGGAILSYYPVCVDPPGASVFTLGAPTPGAYMYIPGSMIFSFGPPTHPSQWLLGTGGGFMTCLVPIPPPCPPGPCVMPFPLLPGGMLLLMHGSSV